MLPPGKESSSEAWVSIDFTALIVIFLWFLHKVNLPLSCDISLTINVIIFKCDADKAGQTSFIKTAFDKVGFSTLR